MSGGTFEIRVSPAGELVPALQVLDAVQQRTVEVGQSASYYFLGKNPALAFDTCIPFGMTARQQTAWLREGGGLELLREIFADFSVVNFVAGNTGAQGGGWWREPLSGLSDLRGRKMRIPGLGGEVMSALGVNVQLIPGGEIYTSLERGALDAAEWVGPYDDEKLGFHRVCDYCYYPGFWEPGPSLSVYVNQEAWASLSAEHKAIFEAGCRAASDAMQERYDARNPPALARLVEGGTQFLPFPDDIMQAAREASEQLVAEKVAADETYRRVHASWDQFRQDSFRWFGMAELAYANAAFGQR